MATLFTRITLCLLAIGTIASVGCAQTADRQTRTRKIVIHGDSKQGAWLGVQLQDVTRSRKDSKELGTTKGAYVSDVVEDSPAEKAGITKGDVIVKFGDATIENSDDLMTAVRNTPPKTEVKIELVRKTDHKVLTATLARQRAPQAYTYSFRMPRMPRMPALPHPRIEYNVGDESESLGLQLEPLTKQLAEYLEVPGGRGLLVTEVSPGSKAEKAGFKAGDAIVKMNGASVRDIEDLHTELADARDTVAAVDIIRRGKPVTLSVQIEKEDDDEEDDDSSIDLWSPDHHHFWHGERESSLRSTMSELRTRLLSLEERLRAKFEQLHRQLRTQFSEL
jgi:serine protease Do